MNAIIDHDRDYRDLVFPIQITATEERITEGLKAWPQNAGLTVRGDPDFGFLANRMGNYVAARKAKWNKFFGGVRWSEEDQRRMRESAGRG